MKELKRLQQLAGINEIKVNKPKINIQKIPLSRFKEILIEYYADLIDELHFENPEQELEEWKSIIIPTNDKSDIIIKVMEFFEERGFGETQIGYMFMYIFIL